MLDPCLRLERTKHVLVRPTPGLAKELEGSIDPALGGSLLGHGDCDGHFSAGWPLEGSDATLVVPVDERFARHRIDRVVASFDTQVIPPREDDPMPFPVYVAASDASCIRTHADAWERDRSLVPIGDAATACGEPLARFQLPRRPGPTGDTRQLTCVARNGSDRIASVS